MQIDIGFGDVVVPEAAMTDYPTILQFDSPCLRAYPRETVIAEKFEAMVKLGQLNSRMKDFFDLWLLSRQFEFDGATLSTAVTRTFENRQTAITAQPVALTPAFANDSVKQTQWQGFLRKSRLDMAPPNLCDVTDEISSFLLPLAEAVFAGQTFAGIWQPSGPWRDH